jgi:hypothetical protein
VNLELPDQPNQCRRKLSHGGHIIYLSIRNEFVDDIKGQRTGFATKYSEHLIGYGRWIGSTVLFRPEIRLDHSYDLAAYDLGTKKTQFIVAGDLTYHF